ncbi:hypothetical protein CKAH01_16932 [Colletotrichum kahawae]|uniref:Uncharacterized protein n=1 Tax=Colletotrichum kahawae TaxID=34407 RepID=A0AAE0D4R4_COLKA|nr:hypothetical protein CKAH01_16932 [Colletotrichum kahawae]
MHKNNMVNADPPSGWQGTKNGNGDLMCLQQTQFSCIQGGVLDLKGRQLLPVGLRTISVGSTTGSNLRLLINMIFKPPRDRFSQKTVLNVLRKSSIWWALTAPRSRITYKSVMCPVIILKTFDQALHELAV